MKKIMNNKKVMLVFLAIIFVFTTGFNSKKNNGKILKQISAMIPDDRFYFVRGLERERSLSTNIRYRGIVYSDKLMEAKAFSGIEIALEDLDDLNKEFIVRKYNNALAFPRLVAPLRATAKKILGDDITVHVNFPGAFQLTYTEDYGDGKKDEGEGTPIANMYITAFTEDLTEMKEADIEKYKKKIFDLHKILYGTYNINATISLYLLNKSDLTYEFISPYIFSLVRDEPKIKKLLDKWKTTGSLKAEEIGYLTDYMVSKPDVWNNVGIVFTKFKSRKTSNPDEIDVHIIEDLLPLMKHIDKTKDRRR